ncbi:MAG: hypothetical protein ACI9OD_001149 [Limisphaerales bacterium]|jgi:hypothetical protein
MRPDRARLVSESAAQSKPTSGIEEWFSLGRFSLVLAFAFGAAFWGVVTGSESFYRSDYGVIGYPAMSYLKEQMLTGNLPLWNPLSNCGAPFLAQWGTMCLYPGTLFLLAAPLTWALGVFSLGHLWLGGVGMYVLARDWTGNNVAAAFAGAAFAFGGATLACLIWPNYCVGLGWMPLLVWSARKAWLLGGGWIAIAALAGTMQMLVGVPELVLLTWLLLGLLWLCEIPEKNRAWHWLSLPLLVILVTGLSMAQLLPFFDLLAQSQRDASFADQRWPMPIWGWANLFVPLFHYGRTDQGVLMQQGQFFLSSYYLGLGVMTFAFLGMWKRREKRVWILGGLTVLVLVLALGRRGMLYSVLVDLFPGGGIARYPIKFVLLAAFTMPLLAAFGVAHFLERTAARAENRFRELTTVIVAVIGEVLILLAVAHWLKNPFDVLPDVGTNTAGRLILYGLLMLAFLKGSDPEIALRLRKVYLTLAFSFMTIDLATHLPGQNPTLSVGLFGRDVLRDTRKMVPPLRNEGRVMISPAAEDQLLLSKVKDPTQDWVGKRLSFWSNLNLLEGVPKLNGSMTLIARGQDEIQKRLYPKKGDPAAAEGLKDFLGVNLITADGSVVGWTNRSTAMPRISAGQRILVLPQGETLDAVLAPNFLPREVVYLTTDESEPLVARRGTLARISVSEAGPNRIICEVEASEPTIVVVAQTYNRNWRAHVNGQPLAIRLANHAYQAVPVPEGKSVVSFEYRERGLERGAFISVATALGLFVSLALTRRRRREQSASSPDSV